MLTKKLLPEGFALRAQLRQWLDETAQLTEFTPDLVELEQYSWIPVFIYGNMMEGHKYEFLLEGKEAERQAIAFTQEEYSVEKRDLGSESFPIAYQYRKSPLSLKRPLRVRGELHKVRPYHFTTLDNHMRNTVEFIRKRVNVVVPLRRHNDYLERLVVVEAMMYFGISSYWGDLEHWMFKPLTTYDHIKEDRPWGKTYYYFSKLECQQK